MIHTLKGFGIVNKAEIDVFLELFCFFHDPADVGDLICGSSAFSKTTLNIWKFRVHILLKPGLENFEHYFTSMWDEYNRAVRCRTDSCVAQVRPKGATPHPRSGAAALRRYPTSKVRRGSSVQGKGLSSLLLKLSTIQLRLFSSEFPSLGFSEV